MGFQGALLLSLLVHVALLRLGETRTDVAPSSPGTPVEIWSPKEGGAGAGGKIANGSGSGHARKLTLRSLLDIGPGSPGDTAGTGGPGKGGGGGADLDTLTEARGMKFEDEVARWPWLDSVWKRVDSGVNYPEDFVKQRIAGSVHLQLRLDGEGKLVGGFRRIESDHPYLRAYVLTALINALKTPLPRSFCREKGMAVALHFEFKGSSDPGAVLRDRGKFARNQMTFLRTAFVPPLWEEKLEQLRKFLPPILPLPGGAFVDFVQAYRMIDSWGKQSEQELRADRTAEIYHLLKRQIEKAN